MGRIKEVTKVWLSTDEAATYLNKTKNAMWVLVSKGMLIKRKWNGNYGAS